MKTNPRYLNHNANRRCDDLIEVLLLVEVDMFYERKRKELLTSTTEASRKVEGDRHTRGQSIANSKVHVQVICYLKNVDLHERVCTITLSTVIQEEGHRYLVDSSDSKAQYSVEILSSTFSDQPNCLPHCMEKECFYLCRHMILFTCYDFQHGHVCKHAQKVFHLHMQQQPVDDDGGNTDAVTDTTNLPSPMKIGVTPSRQHKMKQV